MYLDKQLYEEGRQEVTTTLAFLLRMPMPLLLLFYIQHRAVYEMYMIDGFHFRKHLPALGQLGEISYQNEILDRTVQS